MTSQNTANTQWITCYLGLGSNLSNELGSPKEHIHQAIHRIQSHPKIADVRSSSLYRSKPMGPQNQPDFINAVLEIHTTLTPLELLDFCQSLEQAAKRERLRHWGERSLDVDVLLYGSQFIEHPRLTVPHVGISERNFVLVPLAEISPELVIYHNKQGHLIKTPIQNYPNSQHFEGLEKLED